MIHEYFFVDLRIVWSTVKDDLPKLKQRIDEVLTELRQAGGRSTGTEPVT
jgi:uncharacterized protein with HEPN domain